MEEGNTPPYGYRACTQKSGTHRQNPTLLTKIFGGILIFFSRR